MRAPAWIIVAFGLAILPRAVEAQTGAEQYFIDPFGPELGLPQTNVTAVLQTRDGYLWVGTEGGLARFDGVRFATFRATQIPAFTSHSIRCLFEAKDGALWIGTERGVLRYQKGGFESVGLTSTAVTAIAEDNSGTIWVGTSALGLWTWRERVLQRYLAGASETLPALPVRCLFADTSGELWIGFQHMAGAVRGKPGSFQNYNPGQQLKGDLNAVCEAQPETLWLATAHGLYRSQSGILKRFGNGAMEDQINDVWASRDGGLWIAAGHLLHVADPEHFTPQTIAKLPTENVRTGWEDHEGSVWLTAQADGLVRVRPAHFRTFSTENGLPGNVIKAVAEAANGDLWLAVQRYGVSRLQRSGEVTTYGQANGFPTDNPLSIYVAHDGTVWVAFHGALCSWKNGICTRFPEGQGVSVMFEDSKGRLLLGGEAGAMVRDPNAAFRPILVAGAPMRTVQAFAEDNAGNIYLGVDPGGLFELRGGAGAGARPELIVPVAGIRALYVDPEQRVWVGSRGRGLGVLFGGIWHNPDSLVEAVGEHVAAILPDSHGQLWLGTPAGVLWAKTSDLLAAAQGSGSPFVLRRVGIGDGFQVMPVSSGSQPAAARTKEGELLFATRQGVLLIDPNEMTGEAGAPPVLIETAMADGKSIAPGLAAVVAPGARQITIAYTAPSFIQPSRVLFKYRLDPYDRDWVNADTRRVATYTGLPPGHYRFRVIACNSDGVWSAVGAQLPLVQLPHFYQTGWFRALLVAAFLAAGLGVYRWRTAALRRENDKLNGLVADRTEELELANSALSERSRELELANAAKTEFLESVGHEVRNPLNGLNGLLAMFASKELDARASELIVSARACARSLTRVFEEVLDFSKFDYVGVPVRKTEFSLEALMREIVESFAWQADQQGTPVRLELPLHWRDGFEADDMKIKTIVTNFVANALKYVPKGPIELHVEDLAPDTDLADIHIEVRDHGPGIPAEEQELIFRRFVRGSHAKESRVAGTGLGLATCQVLAEALEGHVGVDSSPGEGSIFYVRLPLRRAGISAAGSAAVPAIRKTALIVEDERYNQTVLRGIAQDLGYETQVAGNVEQAKAALAAADFAVIFLDWELPGSKGAEVAHWLRNRSGGEKPIILATTAHRSADIRLQCQAAGMDEFLSKPYNAAQVARSIAQAERHRHESAELNISAFRHYASVAGTTLEEAVIRYAQALSEEHASLLAALSSQNRPQIAIIAHRLHSLGGVVGAAQLCSCAQRLEEITRIAPAADLTGIARVLSAAVDALLKRVRSLDQAVVL